MRHDGVERSKESSELQEARRLGQLEGERFDERLREQERRERDELMARAQSAEQPRDRTTAEAGVPSDVVLRLRREVEQLSAFQRAVVSSKGWKFLQALRRPFGREWPQRG